MIEVIFGSYSIPCPSILRPISLMITFYRLFGVNYYLLKNKIKFNLPQIDINLNEVL